VLREREEEVYQPAPRRASRERDISSREYNATREESRVERRDRSRDRSREYNRPTEERDRSKSREWRVTREWRETRERPAYRFEEDEAPQGTMRSSFSSLRANDEMRSKLCLIKASLEMSSQRKGRIEVLQDKVTNT